MIHIKQMNGSLDSQKSKHPLLDMK